MILILLSLSYPNSQTALILINVLLIPLGTDAVQCLCDVADGMCAVIATFGKQPSNNATVGNILKSLQKQVGNFIIFSDLAYYFYIVERQLVR